MSYSGTPLAALLPVCLIFIQCSSPTTPDTREPVRLPTDLTEAERQLAASTNEFGFEFFRRVTAATAADSNVFVSPLSAAYALAMAYNGAAGETRDGIATTLAIGGQDTEQVNESYAGLADVLIHADPSVTTTIANAVWYSIHKTLVPAFGDICRDYFQAQVTALDFVQPWAADTVNAWVYENTQGKIEKVFDPPLPEELVFILANAVYFKASWTYPFDADITRTDTFYTGAGIQVSADFMYLNSEAYQDANGQPDPDITYLIKPGEFSAFCMPYGDRWFRMTVFVPDTSLSVEQFISELTVEQWDLWRPEFRADRFEAWLPKFKFEYEAALDDILAAMGMAIAFAPGAADFSNMIETGGVWIDTVIHKTFVQVDEEGTEAAAVTVIGGIESQPPIITCNRPFAFMIWEKESGAVIFAGKVACPVWAE
jgi:serpin B